MAVGLGEMARTVLICRLCYLFVPQPVEPLHRNQCRAALTLVISTVISLVPLLTNTGTFSLYIILFKLPVSSSCFK